MAKRSGKGGLAAALLNLGAAVVDAYEGSKSSRSTKKRETQRPSPEKNGSCSGCG